MSKEADMTDMVTNVIELPKDDSTTYDLVKLSERTTDFWDNEDDMVWDNV